MGKVPRKSRKVQFKTKTHPSISWSTNLARYIDDMESKITYELSDVSDDDNEEKLKDPGGPRADPPKIKTEGIRMPDIVVTGKEKIRETDIFDEKTELFEEIMENHPDNWDEDHLDYEPESHEEEDPKEQVPTSSKRLQTPRTVDFKGTNVRKIKSSTPKVEQKDCMTELNEVFADESGSIDDTSYEKDHKEETTRQVEQTSDDSQPEGITRPIIKKEVIFVSEIHTVDDDSDVEVHDDGGKRFERSETDRYIIKRPKESFDLRKRLENARHRTRGCRIGEVTKINRTIDKESSKNSIFCTPATQIGSPGIQPIPRNSEKQPKGSSRRGEIRKAEKRTGEDHDDLEVISSGDEEAVDYKKKSWLSTQRRPNIKSRLSYTNKFSKIPRVEYDAEDKAQETQRPSPKPAMKVARFESLTTDELLLIAGSSDHLERLGQIQDGVKDAYREVVVKLIRRTGMMGKMDMDPLQRKVFKNLAGDFRRQVAPRPSGYTPSKDTEHREA